MYVFRKCYFGNFYQTVTILSATENYNSLCNFGREENVVLFSLYASAFAFDFTKYLALLYFLLASVLSPIS